MIKNLLVLEILARNSQMMAPFLDSDEIWDFGTTVVAKNMDLDNIMGLEQRGAFANQTNLPDVPGDINISNTNLHP